MTLWLCGYVAMQPCGWTKGDSKRIALKEVHRLGYEPATVPDYYGSCWFKALHKTSAGCKIVDLGSKGSGVYF